MSLNCYTASSIGLLVMIKAVELKTIIISALNCLSLYTKNGSGDATSIGSALFQHPHLDLVEDNQRSIYTRHSSVGCREEGID